MYWFLLCGHKEILDHPNWKQKGWGYKPDGSYNQLDISDFRLQDVEDRRKRISAFRAQYVIGEIPRENWQQAVWKMPTSLDGRHLLIVDEMKSSGSTLGIAKQLLTAAVPDIAGVTGAYFWEYSTCQISDSDGTTRLQMADSVVWYNPGEDTAGKMGRIIGDPFLPYYEALDRQNRNDASFRKLLGARDFIGAPFILEELKEHPDRIVPNDPSVYLDDEEGRMLKEDIRHLHDVYGRLGA